MVASLVPEGRRVADIGTDHALLPRLLLRERGAAFCVASDSSPAGLRRARVHRDAGEPGGRIDLRCGPGLFVLRPEDRIDVIVLSGIGARTIVRILEDRDLGELDDPRLVLQPQNDPPLIRRWLSSHRYAIVAERMVRDRGRYYIAMASERAVVEPVLEHPLLAADELDEVGPCLVRSDDPLVREYWVETLRRQERILRIAVSGGGRQEAERRRDLARRVLSSLPGSTSRDAAEADDALL